MFRSSSKEPPLFYGVNHPIVRSQSNSIFWAAAIFQTFSPRSSIYEVEDNHSMATSVLYLSIFGLGRAATGRSALCFSELIVILLRRYLNGVSSLVWHEGVEPRLRDEVNLDGPCRITNGGASKRLQNLVRIWLRVNVYALRAADVSRAHESWTARTAGHVHSASCPSFEILPRNTVTSSLCIPSNSALGLMNLSCCIKH